MQFTKLFQSILDSTIWQEPNETKILWITMLAMADRNGEVQASLPGLAKRAGITLADCERAIACLKAPDAYSRTKDFDGRRIREVDGGWELLNHAKYRALLSIEERKEYNRKKQAEYRALRKVNDMSMTVNDSQSQSAKCTHAEGESEAEGEAKEIPLPHAGAGELFEPSTPPPEKPVAAAKKPRAPRQPDPVFDAIAEVCGMAGKVNDMNAGQIAVAKKNILQCSPGVTPDEIRRRAANYRHLWPSMSLTPTALAKHWVACEKGTAETVRFAH